MNRDTINEISKCLPRHHGLFSEPISLDTDGSNVNVPKILKFKPDLEIEIRYPYYTEKISGNDNS